VLLVQIAGILIVSLVVGQLLLLLYGSVRRLASEQQMARLRLERLRQEAAAAAVLRQEKEKERHLWEGYRKFVVEGKVGEGAGIASVYLAPHDRKPLPSFQPGQYLTFNLKIPGQDKPVIRCYSLSDSPSASSYRVTIKKIPPPPDKPGSPPGLVSGFFHEQIKEGDILDVQAPRGRFVLDLGRSNAIVLIAGGIGLTPLLSMANWMATQPEAPETWLFYGVRNRREHIMADHLRGLAQARENFHLRVCYSDPTGEDVQGRDYDHAARVSVDLLKHELPSNNYEFYVCGPPGMMASMSQGLKEWGVPETSIFTEAFGPASVPRPAKVADSATTASAKSGPGLKIAFARSGKDFVWDAQLQNLLNLASANGIDIPSGCCAGNCGTCETAIKSGQVRYAREPGWQPQAGTCLVCVAEPVGDLVLDA